MLVVMRHLSIEPDCMVVVSCILIGLTLLFIGA